LMTFIILIAGSFVNKSFLGARPPLLGMIVGCVSFIAGATLPSTFRSLVPGGFWIWVPFLMLGVFGFVSDIQTLSKVAFETPRSIAMMWFYL